MSRLIGMIPKSVSQTFCCSICGKTFKTEVAYKRHKKSGHSEANNHESTIR